MSVLVGREAPDFKAQFVMPDGSFAEKSLADYRGSIVHLTPATTYEVHMTLAGTSTTANSWATSAPC